MFARVAHGTERRAAQFCAVIEEGGDRLAPWYSSGCGGIVSRASCVSSESAAVDVAALDCGGEQSDELALARGVGQRCLLAPRAGVVDRRACPLERSFDGCFAGLEHPGHLGRAEPEHVAEHERGPLARRQVLQRGHECETDRLSCLVPRLRPGRGVRGPSSRTSG